MGPPRARPARAGANPARRFIARIIPTPNSARNTSRSTADAYNQAAVGKDQTGLEIGGHLLVAYGWKIKL